MARVNATPNPSSTNLYKLLPYEARAPFKYNSAGYLSSGNQARVINLIPLGMYLQGTKLKS